MNQLCSSKILLHLNGRGQLLCAERNLIPLNVLEVDSTCAVINHHYHNAKKVRFLIWWI